MQIHRIARMGKICLFEWQCSVILGIRQNYCERGGGEKNESMKYAQTGLFLRNYDNIENAWKNGSIFTALLVIGKAGIFFTCCQLIVFYFTEVTKTKLFWKPNCELHTYIQYIATMISLGLVVFG